MSNKKKELLESLVEFKKKYDRLPTRQDFEAKKITPSYRTYFRIFKNTKNIAKQVDLYERDELVFKEERKEETTPNKATNRITKFRCPFCGSHIQQPFEWATCKTYILMRLVGLIGNNSTNGDYTNAIFDSLFRIFGDGHKDVEFSLRHEGYFETYQKRVGAYENRKA